MPFFGVDTMMVCADTKHGAVQRLSGIYSVYGLTRAYVTQSGRGQTGTGKHFGKFCLHFNCTVK